MSIQALPVELMRLVLGNCSPDDLIALQLTCHSLRLLTEPLLYEDLNYGRRFLRPGRPRLSYLLRTLLHRPELGAHIRYFRIPKGNPDLSSEQKALIAKVLATMMDEFGIWKPEKWSTALMWHPFEIIHMLILSFCSGLKALAFDDDVQESLLRVREYISENFGQALMLANRALSNFESVGTVECGLNGDPVDSPSPMLSRIFTLPRTKVLIMSLLEWHISPQLPYEPFTLPEASTLVTLDIRKSMLTESGCSSILNACPNITELRIELSRDTRPQKYRCPVRNYLDCASLGGYITAASSDSSSLLRIHQKRAKSLRKLSISVSFLSGDKMHVSEVGGGLQDDANLSAPFGISGSIGSLRCLAALKTLEIPLPLLLGWYPEESRLLSDILPNSLSELCFAGDLSHWELYNWDVRAVKAIVEDYVATHGVRIKVIVYRLLQKDIQGEAILLEELGEVCRLAGVRLDVTELEEPKVE
jgi:hypothetical protein